MIAGSSAGYKESQLASSVSCAIPVGTQLDYTKDRMEGLCIIGVTSMDLNPKLARRKEVGAHLALLGDTRTSKRCFKSEKWDSMILNRQVNSCELQQVYLTFKLVGLIGLKLDDQARAENGNYVL